MKKHILDKNFFENLYKKYNKKTFVSPDPLQFLYSYDNIYDREISGLIASLLAYGKVAQILKSVNIILDKLTPQPSAFLKQSSPVKIRKLFLWHPLANLLARVWNSARNTRSDNNKTDTF